jgi:hypothetical protein
MEHGIRAATVSKLNDDMIKAMKLGAHKTIEAIQRELVRRIHASRKEDNQGAAASRFRQHNAYAA